MSEPGVVKPLCGWGYGGRTGAWWSAWCISICRGSMGPWGGICSPGSANSSTASCAASMSRRIGWIDRLIMGRGGRVEAHGGLKRERRTGGYERQWGLAILPAEKMVYIVRRMRQELEWQQEEGQTWWWARWLSWDRQTQCHGDNIALE